MQHPTIRPGELRDAEALAPLMTQLGYPTETTQMRRRMESLVCESNCAAFVAELEGTIVGMIGVRAERGFEYDGPLGEIVAMVVDERWRGRGIGAALITAGERWLRDRGAHKVKINSSNHRTATHRFYERLGYSATGLRFTKALE